MISHRLPKDARVRKRFQFRSLQKTGQRLHTRHFVLALGPALSETPQLGITISKKTAPHAVDRNRVKRLVREAFRRAAHALPPGVAIVFIAKRQATDLTQAEVDEQLARLLPTIRRAARSGLSPRSPRPDGGKPARTKPSGADQ